MKLKYAFFILGLVLLYGCKPELDEFQPSAGSVDFSRYTAIGGSLTAGYTDGELYASGQQYAFANILAKQMQFAGGGDFKQPLMFDEEGYGNRLILNVVTDCKGVAGLSPYPSPANPVAQNFAWIGNDGPFNNMGVVGSKSYHLGVQGYGMLNPYFHRFAADTLHSSVLSDALQSNPSFFTLWTGDYDVLMYAMYGGEQGPDSVTPVPLFNQAVYGVIGQLKNLGAEGAIANIPDITDLPFFTTIPAKGLVLTQGQADSLNFGYQAYNNGAALVGAPLIHFAAGANFFVIEDHSAPFNLIGNLRQIRAAELLTLKVPQDSLKCKKWGSQKPIPAFYVLDEAEISKITAATQSYNGTLLTLAQENNFAYVDVNDLYGKHKGSGLAYDGVKLTVSFVSGGIFGLDGLHLAPRGNALVANAFIDAINSTYGSSIPKVNISDYPGIKFP